SVGLKISGFSLPNPHSRSVNVLVVKWMKAFISISCHRNWASVGMGKTGSGGATCVLRHDKSSVARMATGTVAGNVFIAHKINYTAIRTNFAKNHSHTVCSSCQYKRLVFR